MDDEADMSKYIKAVTSLDFSTKGSHKDDLYALLGKRFADSPYSTLDDDELKWAAGGLSGKVGEENSEKQ